MTTDNSLSNQRNDRRKPEVVPRQGISIVWFVPFIALIFGGWLGIKALSEKGTFITIEFENGAGIVPKQTEIRYKGLVTGLVTKVVPSDDLQSVIAHVEISKAFSDYLTVNTKFWLVSADISFQGVSGLDTLLSGSYIHIIPDTDKGAKEEDHFIALKEAPQLDMTTPGLHLTLQTNVLGSISENSPITFKQIPIGYVTGYHYAEENQAINVNIFIEQEYAHLVKENSLFWNSSGVQVTASISAGIKVNTNSLASIIAGGIAVDTLSYQEKLPVAKNGQKFPLHADFQSAEMGYEIELTLDWNSGVNHNATILYQGLTIGTIESFSKLDPKSRKITAKAKVNPRIVPYLTDESQFYLVSPHIDLTGISNAKTLLSGTYISIRPSLQGKPTNKFSVFNTKPPYQYTEPGLHLVLESNDRNSLQVGSKVYYKQQTVGSVQTVETIGAKRHLIHIHIEKEYQDYVSANSHFYNNSGLKIKANLQGVTIEAQTLQSILTGGISFINFDEELNESEVINGDKFNLFPNKKLARQRTRFTLTTSADEQVSVNTKILYRGKEIGAVHKVDKQGDSRKLFLGLLPKYQYILREGTQFWLAKPNLSLSGTSDLNALLGGTYITFNLYPEGSNDKTDFLLLTAPPAKHASAAGLQLSLLSESANVASPGSSISYRGVTVGQVDNVTLDKKADKVRVNITIDEAHKSLIQVNTRFYNASGITLNGSINGFVVKTESVDAILRGGISFYNPPVNLSAHLPDNITVKELENFNLFDDVEQANNAGLSISVHFNDFTGVKVNTKVIYQEQEIGKVERLVFNANEIGVTALVLLNDTGAKYAKQESKFWLVEPTIGLVGTKDVSNLLSGAFIAIHPDDNLSNTVKIKFQALAMAPTVTQLPYGLNIKLTAQRLGSIRVGNPVLYRQIPVGEVIGVDLSATADTVNVFINIGERYAPLINSGSQFWNISGINVEADLFSGLSIDSESIETLLSGGIAFATPEATPEFSNNDDEQEKQSYILHQDFDEDWLEWQPKITIGQ
jgi:paraquat-inducible protein B